MAAGAPPRRWGSGELYLDRSGSRDLLGTKIVRSCSSTSRVAGNNRAARVAWASVALASGGCKKCGQGRRSPRFPTTTTCVSD